MKLLPVVSTALLLMFGTGIATYAQDQPADKPAHQQDDTKPPKPDDKTKPDDKAKPDKPAKTQDDAKPPKDTKQANPSKQDKQAAQAHGNHGRIPDDKFKAHFGQEHKFHIGHPTVVNGSQQFSYSGYTFQYTEVWPTQWAYTDEFFIIFVDGTYYLCDVSYPGVQLEIIVLV